MQANDVLMKKWCFGFGRSKARTEATMNNQGELQTYNSFPKYRTIVFKVSQARKQGKQWLVEGDQYSSLNGKPKKTSVMIGRIGPRTLKTTLSNSNIPLLSLTQRV